MQKPNINFYFNVPSSKNNFSFTRNQPIIQRSIADKPERFFVNETIRENLIELQQRNPYAVKIVTEEFFEDENIIRIRSLIMVERETSKGIIVVIKDAKKSEMI
jgi:GTPase Era involved in 16S rRNA processing